MSSRPCVVILSSIDWDSAWQRHQIFAEQFSAAGYPVIFVENTGFRNPGLADLSRVRRKVAGWFARNSASNSSGAMRLIRPRVLPPTFSLFRFANYRWFAPALAAEIKRLGGGPRPIVLAYLP